MRNVLHVVGKRLSTLSRKMKGYSITGLLFSMMCVLIVVVAANLAGNSKYTDVTIPPVSSITNDIKLEDRETLASDVPQRESGDYTLRESVWDSTVENEILRLSALSARMESSVEPVLDVPTTAEVEELRRTSTPIPTAAPTPTPEVQPVEYGIPQLAALCKQYSDWNFWTCYNIGDCEMGGYWQPYALGSQLEVGVFQIHPIHWQRVIDLGYTWADLYDPAINVIVAHDIWAERGWSPWSCYWRI